MLTVGNTDHRFTDWIQERFGGTVYCARKPNPRWKPCYMWRVSQNAAVELLRMVRPYLVVKGEQADLFFGFQQHVEQHKSYFGRLGPEEIEWRETQIAQLHALNARGVSLSVDLEESAT